MLKKVLIIMFLIFLLIPSYSLYASNISSNIANCKTVSQYSSSTKVDNMDTVIFGNYKGEPINWIVLEKQEDLALLITKDVVDGCTYNGPDEYEVCAYEDS